MRGLVGIQNFLFLNNRNLEHFRDADIRHVDMDDVHAARHREKRLVVQVPAQKLRGIVFL